MARSVVLSRVCVWFASEYEWRGLFFFLLQDDSSYTSIHPLAYSRLPFSHEKGLVCVMMIVMMMVMVSLVGILQYGSVQSSVGGDCAHLPSKPLQNSFWVMTAHSLLVLTRVMSTNSSFRKCLLKQAVMEVSMKMATLQAGSQRVGWHFKSWSEEQSAYIQFDP